MELLLEILLAILLGSSEPQKGRPMPLWGIILRAILGIVWLGLLILISLVAVHCIRDGRYMDALQTGLIALFLLGLMALYVVMQMKKLKD